MHWQLARNSGESEVRSLPGLLQLFKLLPCVPARKLRKEKKTTVGCAVCRQ